MTPPNGRPSYLPGDSLAGAESQLAGTESANACGAESHNAFGRCFRALGARRAEKTEHLINPGDFWLGLREGRRLDSKFNMI